MSCFEATEISIDRMVVQSKRVGGWLGWETGYFSKHSFLCDPDRKSLILLRPISKVCQQVSAPYKTFSLQLHGSAKRSRCRALDMLPFG